MENENCAREIIESFEGITVEKVVAEGVILFSILKRRFLFVEPVKDQLAAMPRVYLCAEGDIDIPHVLLKESNLHDFGSIPEGKYHYVCLFEDESNVNTIIPYREKVYVTLVRLKELFSLSKYDKQREYRKEFLYYWNHYATDPMVTSIYLRQEDSFAELDVYYGNNEMRVVERGLILSDIDSRNDKNERNWVRHLENDVYYIPITDCREIIPPHPGCNWTPWSINNIIYSQQISHISPDTFEKIKSCVPTRKDIILIFGMKVDSSNVVVFAMKLKCKNTVGHSLFVKLADEVLLVEPLRTIQKDYRHLCSLIGNDIGLEGKKAVVIGAGSLGSYVAFELVKNGVAKLRIYDSDSLSDENILRWAYAGIGKGKNKAEVLALLLSILHPEIYVEAINRNIVDEDIITEVQTADMLLFTVGSSDEQLHFNRLLKRLQCTVPVYYIWIEAGGNDSHILFVNYEKTGCFECLYTDISGKQINNQANKNSVDVADSNMVSNGCGGTRAAYGTAVILRTVAALLEMLKRVQMKDIKESVLIDINHVSINVSDMVFPIERCGCCGTERKQ